MGQLFYGPSSEPFVIDDRTLAHIEIVVLAKLRRNESFALSLDGADAGRTTLWISSASTLQLRFDEARHDINRAWLDQLIDSANTTAGMRIVPEPGAATAQ